MSAPFAFVEECLSSRETVDVALVIPLHGSAGMFGPSCELCARLAVEEVNRRGGVLARELRLGVVDGSGSPASVADEVGALANAGLVDAVVGWHLSSVRQAVAARIGGTIPYVYTALYEGGEATPGVFLVGETPKFQLRPAMNWLRDEHGVRRWCVVGNEYVWPRVTTTAARTYAKSGAGEIVNEMFVPLGTSDFQAVVRRVRSSAADAVLMLLVGEDAAHFNRAFSNAGLDESIRRLSTLIDENTLLASGAEGTRGICAAAAYFEALATPESLEFGARYQRRFGPDAPKLNSLGESCYEGMLLLAALAERARSLEVTALTATADSVSFGGARGELRLRGWHVEQRVYLAEAIDFEFSVVTQL
jgi:urea transport system substrate-binding protein